MAIFHGGSLNNPKKDNLNPSLSPVFLQSTASPSEMSRLGRLGRCQNSSARRDLRRRRLGVQRAPKEQRGLTGDPKPYKQLQSHVQIAMSIGFGGKLRMAISSQIDFGLLDLLTEPYPQRGEAGGGGKLHMTKKHTAANGRNGQLPSDGWLGLAWCWCGNFLNFSAEAVRPLKLARGPLGRKEAEAAAHKVSPPWAHRGTLIFCVTGRTTP